NHGCELRRLDKNPLDTAAGKDSVSRILSANVAPLFSSFPSTLVLLAENEYLAHSTRLIALLGDSKIDGSFNSVQHVTNVLVTKDVTIARRKALYVAKEGMVGRKIGERRTLFFQFLKVQRKTLRQRLDDINKTKQKAAYESMKACINQEFQEGTS
ncbi:hypothetical protein PM082_007533, partial [Marasmius tenuissimus]